MWPVSSSRPLRLQRWLAASARRRYEPGRGREEVTAFTFYDRLITGFAEVVNGGRPLYELAAPNRPLVEDLSELPADATFLRTIGTPRSLERLAAADRLTAVCA